MYFHFYILFLFFLSPTPKKSLILFHGCALICYCPEVLKYCPLTKGGSLVFGLVLSWLTCVWGPLSELQFTWPCVNVCVFQAGWKENHATFMCELKNLQAFGLTTLGHALRTAFDLLNLNRLVSGIDNYGQVFGRQNPIMYFSGRSLTCCYDNKGHSLFFEVHIGKELELEK